MSNESSRTRRPRPKPAPADIIARDAEGRPIVVVEVKSRRLSGKETDHILEQLKPWKAPYAMVVDPVRISVARKGERESTTLDTVTVLQAYEPEFANKEIFGFYFEGLVEAWLRDVAYRWKLEQPPGIEALNKLGLAEFLTSGTTFSRG